MCSILLLAGLPGALFAQGLPVVGFEVVFEGRSRDASVEALANILRTTIALAIEERGFRPVSPPDAEYLLSARYSIDGERVDLRLILSEIPSGREMESTSISLQLDPQFDLEVSRGTQGLLDAVGRAAAARPRPEPPAPQEPPAPPDSGAAEPTEIAVLEPEPKIRGTSGATVSAGVLLPFGGASDYFRVAPRVEAAWLFPSAEGSRWRAAASVGFAAATLSADGAPDAQTVFAQAGFGAEFGIVREKKFKLGLSASAGPSLAFVRGASLPAAWKLLPFVQAGAAAGYRPSPRWELRLSVPFLVLLDYGESLLPLRPIWGAAPAISVTREL